MKRPRPVKHSVKFKKYNELESKLNFDIYTLKHSFNVARYSVRLLRQLQYDVDESVMYFAGLFHDIGKSKIDPDILNKNGILSVQEFSCIENHSFLGYNMLLERDIHPSIQTSAFFHHERFDGMGYPLGLKGDEIPVSARIISICDVFDALTSDRSYRKAYSFQEAVMIMRNQCGQFDPVILKVFFSNIQKITCQEDCDFFHSPF